MTVVAEQLGPHLRMPLLDPRQLLVDLALPGVGLLGRQDAVEERGVGFVLPVVQPVVQIALRHWWQVTIG